MSTGSHKSIKCYIEEYENQDGRLAARLREKGTGHKVDFGFVDAETKRDFLGFLGAAKANQAMMPDLFTIDGEADFISVSGDVDFDSPDEIRFIYNDRLQYLFA